MARGTSPSTLVEDSAKWRLRYMPSGRSPISARERTPGRKGMFPLSMTTVAPPPRAISREWPSRPKPVTSVQLPTSKFTMMSRAVLLRVRICSTAWR